MQSPFSPEGRKEEADNYIARCMGADPCVTFSDGTREVLTDDGPRIMPPEPKP